MSNMEEVEAAGSLNYRCGRVYRAEFFFGGVVKEAEAKSDILSPELTGQRWKWVRARDACPSCAVKWNVSGSGYQLHACESSVFGNGEFDDHASVFPLHGFWNYGVPVLLHVMKHTLQVGTEIYSLSITENLKVAHLVAWGSSAQTKIAGLGEIPASGLPRPVVTFRGYRRVVLFIGDNHSHKSD